jgi:hypothetical protein
VPDLPITHDWNDNRTTGIGMVRAGASGLTWFTKNAFDGGQNQRQLTFGQPGDIPLAWGVPR